MLCAIAVSLVTTNVMADPKGGVEESDIKSTLTNQLVASSPVDSERKKKGMDAFADVYKVLQHPRCLNCHPSGDAPLQNDDSKPHAMNITRASVDAGLECAACHQEKTKIDEHSPK